MQSLVYIWQMENTQKPKGQKPDPVGQLMQYQSDVFDLLGQTLNKSKGPAKRPEPIAVLGLSVPFQSSFQINTRGKNIVEGGTFEMYNTRDSKNRVYCDVSEMGSVIVALTSHAVSVHIW